MLQGGSIPQARVCVGCGTAFIARRPNQVRHRADCGRESRPSGGYGARTRERAAPYSFVGIDGEGVTDPGTGEHKYVLLGCGDKHLEIDGAALHFLDILPFLWGCFKENERAVYVGFYLSYDWGQWFRELPVYEAFSLFHPEGGSFRLKGKTDPLVVAPRIRRVNPEKGPWPVRWENWEFDYLPGKRFRFRPRHPLRIDHLNRGPYMNICDAGAFFQTTFLKAIDPSAALKPVVTREEFAIIKEGKDRRAAAEFDPAMIRYNRLECEVLSRLMHEHDLGIRAMGLRLRRSDWYGPGQVAELWLGKAGAPKGKEIRDCTPEAVREAGRAAYYGGWFEQFWHGEYPGRSYEYDINSAYPFVMASLPCLLHGEWQYDTRRPHNLAREEKGKLAELGFALVKAEVKGRHMRVGAMPHRMKDARILRPRQTAGWYWAAELAAAYDAGFIDSVRVYEVYRFVGGCTCEPPLRGLAELYAGRLLVGKDTPQGKAAKLIYNSTYGKQAQSVGQPTWANPLYASAITSGCRTMVTRAIASHPKRGHDLLMVATDGVIFASPHPGLDLDPERLGAWSTKERENLSTFLPGLYWDDKARAQIEAGETPVFRSRGVSARDFAQAIATVDRAWGKFARLGWPKVFLPVSFQVVSPKQALARGDWSLCGRVRRDARRLISADPKDKRKGNRPGWSTPFEVPGDVVKEPGLLWSTAYEGRFGDELRAGWAEDDGDHPDGPPQDLRMEALFDR